jgi:hypothetical protein
LCEDRRERKRDRKESIMSNKEAMTPEEEKKNNRFSFIVGIFIAMAIIVVFTLFFH